MWYDGHVPKRCLGSPLVFGLHCLPTEVDALLLLFFPLALLSFRRPCFQMQTGTLYIVERGGEICLLFSHGSCVHFMNEWMYGCNDSYLDCHFCLSNFWSFLNATAGFAKHFWATLSYYLRLLYKKLGLRCATLRLLFKQLHRHNSRQLSSAKWKPTPWANQWNQYRNRISPNMTSC